MRVSDEELREIIEIEEGISDHAERIADGDSEMLCHECKKLLCLRELAERRATPTELPADVRARFESGVQAVESATNDLEPDDPRVEIDHEWIRDVRTTLACIDALTARVAEDPVMLDAYHARVEELEKRVRELTEILGGLLVDEDGKPSCPYGYCGGSGRFRAIADVTGQRSGTCRCAAVRDALGALEKSGT